MFYFFPNNCWTSRSPIYGYVSIWSIFLSPLCCDLVISILKIKCNLSFHWELVDCKLLRGQQLRAQVCGATNIHRVEICCIGSRGTAGEFVSVSQVIFTPIVVFNKKIGPHPTSLVLSRISCIASDLALLKDEQKFKLRGCVGAHKMLISCAKMYSPQLT
jgi:hypothetical protein